MISRMSVFHKELVDKKENKISVLERAFATAYFHMKENLPNRIFLPFINFITSVIGVLEMKYFQHRSEGSVNEIFLTIGNVVKEITLKKVRAASCFGLMTDETTDVGVSSQLITFVQYFDTESGTVETKFLSAQDVLKEHDAANAQAIYDLLKEELLSSQLDIKDMMGLATDGASVMVGIREGLASKLKRDNPCIISIHCVCHKLALACTDSNEDTKYIKDVSDILRQTWKHFENSPKRMALLMKVLTNLNKVKVSSTNGKKVLAKKLKKACKTRWLSFDKSVEAMKQQYCGVMQTLQELDSTHNDATAAGLLKKMKNAKFIGALYILAEVLPVLSSLSLTFQRSNINFSLIQPQIKVTKQHLNRIVEEDIPLDKLQADVV